MAVRLLADEGAGPRPPSRAVCRMAERMLRALGLDAMELSVLLTGDATIRALNRDHRRIDRPTDVLAFSQHEDARGRFVSFTPRAGGLLGDVVISLDTARRDARAARIELDEELALLLAHGLLHLLGMDHRDDAEERRMKARTQPLAHAGLAIAGRSSRSAATVPKIAGRSSRRPQKER